MAADRPAAEPAPAPHPIALRMQILTTEHWSLLASRGLAWNESFARVGMYLTSLSGAMVALGLVAGLDHSGATFRLAALVVLPIVLFIGIATVLRLGATNYHDAMAIVGMNRIRAAYLELVPDLEPLFVMGVHDDPAGVARTMAVPPGLPAIAHLLAAAPFVVIVLNGVMAGSLAAVLLLGLGIDRFASVVAAVLVGGLVVVGQLRVVQGGMRRGRAGIRPMYPGTNDA